MIPAVVIIRDQEQHDRIVATFEANKPRMAPHKVPPIILIIPEGVTVVTPQHYDKAFVGNAGEAIPGTYVSLS